MSAEVLQFPGTAQQKYSPSHVNLGYLSSAARGMIQSWKSRRGMPRDGSLPSQLHMRIQKMVMRHVDRVMWCTIDAEDGGWLVSLLTQDKEGREYGYTFSVGRL